MFKKFLFYFLITANLILIGFHSVAQDQEETFEKSLLFRGKAMGGFIFEDWWMVTATIGTEYRFAKNHSVGIDAVIFKDIFERDIWDTINNVETGTGFRQYDRRTFVLLDYRYYLNPDFAVNNRFSLYLSSYGKIGKSIIWNEDGYLYEKRDIIFQKENFIDYGIALGIRSGAREDNLVGIDFNFGYSRRFFKRDTDLYISENQTLSTFDYSSSTWLPSVRFNLYVYPIQ